MAQPGAVLCYEQYQFEDGSKRDKLFVVLCAAGVDEPCLVLKTTSKPDRYLGATRGCNRQKKVFFVPVDWGSCFTCDTYVQLPQVIEIPTLELLQGSLGKTIKTRAALPLDCLAQLRNCLKFFRQDLSERHWKLIFG